MKRAALLLFLTIGAPALAADKSAAHVHARKANGLAAAGKCKQAIPEYNAAYQTLKDPALLFNRAECLRKLGRGSQAVYDYKKFLEAMPAAPNRKLVEGRILELDPSSGIQTKTIAQTPPVVETPAPPAAAAPPVDVPPAPPLVVAALSPVVAVPEKEPAPALQTAALRTPMPVVAEPAPMPVATAPMLVAQPAPAETAAPAQDRAWLWLSLAAAVVAASAGGALYISGKPRNP